MRSPASHARHRKIVKQAAGYYGARSTNYRTAKQAVQYLVVLHETLGLGWMTPDLFRFVASSLLNDVLMQIRKQKTGLYQSPDYFTLD